MHSRGRQERVPASPARGGENPSLQEMRECLRASGLRDPEWYAYHVVAHSTVLGEILWTEESEAHIARHGVTPSEVEDAIYARPRWVEKGR
jgi:hypothetical protein